MRVSSESAVKVCEKEVPAFAAERGDDVVMEIAEPMCSQPSSLGKPETSKPMPCSAPLYLLPEIVAVVPSSLPITPP